MYLFPRFKFPQMMIEAAKLAHQEPDTFYAMALLEATGVVINGIIYFINVLLLPLVRRAGKRVRTRVRKLPY